MTAAQRDYFDEDGITPLLCNDCHRPAYYDRTREEYAHALNPARGCFLIAAEEDLEDDRGHPLMRNRQRVAVALEVDLPSVYPADGLVAYLEGAFASGATALAELIRVEVHSDPAAIFP
jgi:hypothetical protein